MGGMRILCKNCDLNSHIEEYRQRLNNIIVKKNKKLLSEEVIYLSEFIDELINNCENCNKNNWNKRNYNDLDKKFYYYGEEHLFINLYQYIADKIKENKLIYFCVEPQTYNELLKFFTINRIPIKNFRYKSLKSLNFEKRNLNLIDLNKEVNKFFFYDANKYSGIEWIINPKYIVSEILRKEYSSIQSKAYEIMKEMNINIIRLYNLYDCLNENSKSTVDLEERHLDVRKML